MNARDYDEFKMVNLGKSFNLDDNTFDSTVELVKEEILPPVQSFTDNYHKEIFARGIGMIYRIDIDRQYCPPEQCMPGQIEFGLEVEYKLKEYQQIE